MDKKELWNALRMPFDVDERCDSCLHQEDNGVCAIRRDAEWSEETLTFVHGNPCSNYSGWEYNGNK